MASNFLKGETKDIHLIQRLASESWHDAYKNILSKDQIEYMLSTMYSESEISSQLNDHANYYYYMVYDYHKALGFLGFEHHYQDRTTKLHRLYLVPEAKGLGFGRKAFQFLVEKTQKAGDQKIILNVNKNNPAIDIYQKLGFQIYDEGVFDIGNNYVMDDYLMEYKILQNEK